MPHTVSGSHPFESTARDRTRLSGRILIDHASAKHDGERRDAGVRVYAHEGVARTRRDLGVIQEYERLDQLADVRGADETIDGTMPASAGGLHDAAHGGGFRAADYGSGGVHFRLHEVDTDNIGPRLISEKPIYLDTTYRLRRWAHARRSDPGPIANLHRRGGRGQLLGRGAQAQARAIRGEPDARKPGSAAGRKALRSFRALPPAHRGGTQSPCRRSRGGGQRRWLQGARPRDARGPRARARGRGGCDVADGSPHTTRAPHPQHLPAYP